MSCGAQSTSLCKQLCTLPEFCSAHGHDAGGSDGTLRLWTAGSSVAGAAPAAGLKAAQTLSTKATPVSAVAFTRRNLLLAAGQLLLLPSSKQL